MTIKLRNPIKLGGALVSWLKVEGLDCEWTAVICLYFLKAYVDFSLSLGSLVAGTAAAAAALEPVAPSARRRDAVPAGDSRLVVVAEVSMASMLKIGRRAERLYYLGVHKNCIEDFPYSPISLEKWERSVASISRANSYVTISEESHNAQ